MTAVNEPAGGGQHNNDPGAGGTPEPGDSFSLDSLPEAMRGHASLTGIDSLESMGQRLIDTHGRVPVVPENADAYKLTVGEGQQINEDFQKSFKAMAHEGKFTQSQVDTLTKFWSEATTSQQKGQIDALEKAFGETKAKLVEDWGDKYDANIQGAHAMIQKFGGPALVAELNMSNLGNNPELAKFLHKISVAVSEDSIKPGGDPPPSGPVGTGGKKIMRFESMENQGQQ